MTTYVDSLPETEIVDEIEIGVKSNCYVLSQGDDSIYLDPGYVEELVGALQNLPEVDA